MSVWVRVCVFWLQVTALSRLELCRCQKISLSAVGYNIKEIKASGSALKIINENLIFHLNC